MGHVLTVNRGSARPDRGGAPGSLTGIDKHAVDGRVDVRAPGARDTGVGSGLSGDFIGDRVHHGGDAQALYAVPREDLDYWEQALGRSLRSGFFGENLTTVGIDPNQALLGERWRVGPDVELEVTYGRIPCNTFRAQMDQQGWLKTFTERARPGAYLAVRTPGTVGAGDEIEVTFRPDHEVTISLAFQAVTTRHDLLPELIPARDYLGEKALDLVTKRGLLQSAR